MERLAAPQTHLSLKAMIKEVDEDQDGKLSFREVKFKKKQNNKVYYYGSCNLFGKCCVIEFAANAFSTIDGWPLIPCLFD
jgi:hypothetical protein